MATTANNSVPQQHNDAPRQHACRAAQ